MIEADALTLAYGDTVVLREVSMQVPRRRGHRDYRT